MKCAHKFTPLLRPRLLVAWCLSISWGMAQQPATQTAQPSVAKTPVVGGKAPVAAIPSLTGVSVQQYRPPRDKNFETLSFYWWQVAKQPKAVLVLADEEARTSVFLNQTWTDFLKLRSWSVLVVGIKGAKTPIVLDSAIANLEQRLFSWIDLKTRQTAPGTSDERKEGGEKGKGPVPVFFHASGSAAFWMESLMLRQPARFAAWLAVDPVKFPEIPRGKDFQHAPGGFMPLVAPLPTPLTPAAMLGVKKYCEQLDHFEELRSRNERGRVSFIPWATGSSIELRDSFARMYLDAAANAEDDDHIWLNVQTLLEHPLSATDKPDPANFGWLPRQDIVGAVKLFRPATLPVPAPDQSRSFLKTEEFASCELRWIKTVPKPKAVLVVAANLLPVYLRYSTEWMDYARKHEWAILLMSLKEGRIPSFETAASNLETHLNQAIEAFAGSEFKNLQLITFAQGTPAMWLQTLMLRQPSRYLAWIALGAPRFPSVTTTVKVPPGLIISQNAGQYAQSLLHFEDLRGTDPYNPVCFLPLADTKPPGTSLEAAFRTFLDAAISAGKDTVRWVHLHSLTLPPNSITSRPEPKNYAWFPSSDMLGIWKTLRQDTIPVPLPIIAKRIFKTKIAEVPELKLFVRMPSSLMKGQVAKGVICFCTWQQEDTTLINRLKSTEDTLINFADRNSMAMITWNTASMLPEGVNISNITQEIEDKLQTKFSEFGEEWRAAIKKVCHEFKLQDKDMLLHGVSRGAVFAHQISMRYPQQFLAVHTHIGKHYNETLPKEAKNTFWLVTTGEVDGGYQDSFELYSKLKKIGAPTLFKAGENLGHSSRRDIEELGVAFFTYALNLRTHCENEKLKNRTHKDTPVSLFQNAVAAPPWFGDFINQQAYQKGNPELDAIPVEQRVPLPTEDIAKAWGMSLDVATAKKAPLNNFAAGK